ncbi:MAG: hypothetical protein HN350_20605 [Phycisphaerales bacterium]|nr:hypothetical protein [Phycisphaerales bacterium]
MELLDPDGIWNSQSMIPVKPKIQCHKEASAPRSIELMIIVAIPIIQSIARVICMPVEASDKISQDITTRCFVTTQGSINVARRRQPQIIS